MEEIKKNERDEVFSKIVRAGNRTYFFDVKSTRKGELFLTLTESKKILDDDEKFHFDKHKIFLYREDFEKFIEGFNESLEYIKNNSGPIQVTKFEDDK